MWGSWFGVTFTGLFVVLLLIGIAFGTSALLFPVLIAAGLGLLAAAIVIGRRVAGAGNLEGSRNPRSGGAPESGEGSGSPTSSTGPTA